MLSRKCKLGIKLLLEGHGYGIYNLGRVLVYMFDPSVWTSVAKDF